MEEKADNNDVLDNNETSVENSPAPPVVVVEDENYVGERNEKGEKHGQGKYTYENGVLSLIII